MSLLSQVLQTAEKVQIEEINAKIPHVKEAVSTCKNDVLTFMENVYIKFMERPKRNKILASKSAKLQEEAEFLTKNFEEISKKSLVNAKDELDQNLTSLQKVNFALEQVQALIQVHEGIVAIRNLAEINSFTSAIKKIKEIERYFEKQLEHDKLQVWQPMKVTLISEKNSLLDKITKIYQANVVLTSEDTDKSCISSIKIAQGPDNLEEILQAFYNFKAVITPLDNTAKFLWQHVLEPVITKNEVQVQINDSSNPYAVLEITVPKIDTSKSTRKFATYDQIFENLKTVLNFLQNHFNYKLADDLTSLQYIGRHLEENLCENLIKNCLQNTIPSTAEGLQNYTAVIQKTEELQQLLIDTGIFAPASNKLLDYVNNIDVHFINKKCNEYINKARVLLKKDLHDMTEVGTAEDPNNLQFTEFPKCCVSKNVLEFLNLVEELFQEAVTVSDVCAGRLFCTAKNIVDLYGTFVPEHHKKFLQTIPQQTALFHNNCSYISYNLLEFNKKYSKTLSGVLSLPCAFSDEGRQLQKISSDMFTEYVTTQIKQIDEIMSNSNLAQHQTLDKMDPIVEKSVRQCLRQQELLKTVWMKVLPYSLYSKTLGAILNSLCQYLINSVVKFEDISSDSAEGLVEIFKIVTTRGPKLFVDPKEVSLFVDTWYKFNDVLFVLGASLVEINDRWADGKGPLALQLKALELKQMIRSLFQNTERRAALLSKIHDL